MSYFPIPHTQSRTRTLSRSAARGACEKLQVAARRHFLPDHVQKFQRGRSLSERRHQLPHDLLRKPIEAGTVVKKAPIKMIVGHDY
jgi:hypothetical protein